MSKEIRVSKVATLDLSPEVKAKASLLMNSYVKGSDQVLISPIAKGTEPDVMLSKLDILIEANKGKLNSVLSEFEKDQRSKFGPRSIAKPWDLIKDQFLEQYSNSNKTRFTRINLKQGNSILRPLSFENTLDKLRNSSSSGLPALARKGDVKSSYTKNQWMTELKRDYPAIMFERTQEQMKTRIVWGMPLSKIIDEARYFFPLLEQRKKLPFRSALTGPDAVALRVTALIQECRTMTDGMMLSLDFSSYDQSITPYLMRMALEKFKSYFQYSPDLDRDFNNFERYLSSVGILVPDGIIYGVHGLPSGSMWTNEVGSEVQNLIYENSGIPVKYDLTGDDSTCCIKNKDTDVLIQKFKSFGFQVNETKSYKSRDYSIYLQNLFHVDYEKDGIIYGIYSIYRALNRIIYPERWDDFEGYSLLGKDFYSIRTISILENCKHHPLYYEFVKLIYSLDKYSLEYDERSLSKYIKYMEDKRGTFDQIRNQYSDNISGFQNFETVKILSKLSA